MERLKLTYPDGNPFLRYWGSEPNCVASRPWWRVSIYGKEGPAQVTRAHLGRRVWGPGAPWLRVGAVPSTLRRAAVQPVRGQAPGQSHEQPGGRGLARRPRRAEAVPGAGRVYLADGTLAPVYPHALEGRREVAGVAPIELVDDRKALAIIRTSTWVSKWEEENRND